MKRRVTTIRPKGKRSRQPRDPLDQAIEACLDPGQFISYRTSWSFVDGAEVVAKQIEAIVGEEPERAAHLFEVFIASCHEKAEEIDDSGGNFGMLVDDLFHGWIKARQTAGADPDDTADSLLAWMEDDSYGFCYDLDREAAKALDKRGLEAFSRRIRSKFESALVRVPGVPFHLHVPGTDALRTGPGEKGLA